MKNIKEFVQAWKEVSNTKPRAGDWSYHRECISSGYEISIYEVDEGYLVMPCLEGFRSQVVPEDVLAARTYRELEAERLIDRRGEHDPEKPFVWPSYSARIGDF